MKKFNSRQFIASIPALAMVSCYREKPDLILYNGDIITVNPLQPKAEAIAISGDKIIAVGSNEEILNKNYVISSSFKAHDQYSETVKNENIVIENLLNKIYQDILILMSENQLK